MGETKKGRLVNKGFGMANVVLVFTALILSVISSNKAYSLSQINLIIASSVAVIILYAVVIFMEGKKNNKMLMDVIHFITTILIIASLCMLISGRVDLMGYIYFSDLESGNPVAVSALNLAMVASGIYILAWILNIISGFTRNEQA